MSLAAPGRLWGSRRRAVAVAEPRAGATVAPEDCIGLVTRTLAFAIDGAVINGVAVVVVAVLSLCASIVTLPKELVALVVAAGGTVYVLWTVGYFVAFWSTTGQTPGDRVMRVRVVTSSGGPLKPRRALLRFGALLLAALPLGAGFLLILFDDHRRGLQDRIARTLVVDARPERGQAAAASRP